MLMSRIIRFNNLPNGVFDMVKIRQLFKKFPHTECVSVFGNVHNPYKYFSFFFYDKNCMGVAVVTDSSVSFTHEFMELVRSEIPTLKVFDDVICSNEECRFSDEMTYSMSVLDWTYPKTDSENFTGSSFMDLMIYCGTRQAFPVYDHKKNVWTFERKDQ